MTIELLHHTPLKVADIAIGKCWDRPSPEGTVNTERIERVGNKNKHASTLEHLNYSFDIDGISRACLQELARHRHASMSVKSTRYTLKELKDEDASRPQDWYKEYAVVPDEEHTRLSIRKAMQELCITVQEGISNDLVKYCLPESYKTSLVWTINARSLQNFLQLRTNKSALWEIRELAYSIFNNLPEDHKYLFEEFLYKEKESES